MKEDVQRKWIEALRSGEYVKCHGKLAMWSPYTGQFAYCALGVLVEVARLDGVPIVLDKDVPTDDDDETQRVDVGCPNDDTDWYEVRLNQMNSALPDEVVQWAGLETNNPLLVFPHEHFVAFRDKYEDRVFSEEEHVAFLNDEVDFEFSTLADFIENCVVR